ncbi:MAG: deoxyribonuclease V [Dehalococcoidia bacterium]|nr:deoxyribonuclease V [Dehalococcoidia bacterium]
MRSPPHDPWPATPADAIALQKRLAPRVLLEGDPPEAAVRTVAGCDLAFLGRGRRGDTARAAVVLLSYPDLTPLEQQVVEAPVTFPYIPGLLAFRELPVLLQAFEKIERTPDLLLVDGQGYAHPRRFGIACHLGLLLDLPAIGVAKSRLTGEHEEPAPAAASRTDLRHDGELIGVVLRTRDGGRPLYVSPGHRIGFAPAAEWVMRLSRGHRLPEPTRLADRLSKGLPP